MGYRVSGMEYAECGMGYGVWADVMRLAAIHASRLSPLASRLIIFNLSFLSLSLFFFLFSSFLCSSLLFFSLLPIYPYIACIFLLVFLYFYNKKKDTS